MKISIKSGVKIKEKITARLPTEYGPFVVYVYVFSNSEQHLALVKGTPTKNMLVRIHSKCLTGEAFHSKRCDCREQLDLSLQRIATEERGILIYLDQEGRGIGIFNKIKAYALQDKGMDTVEANVSLGFEADGRNYAQAAEMLKDLGVATVRLLTNNLRKVEELQKNGIVVVERIPLITPATRENKGYIKTKKEKLGHIFE